MADRNLPLGQITPVARPIGAFAQPAQFQPAAPARPVQLDNPTGINTIAISGTSSVQGSNQFEQLAQALAPFSRALTETVGQGYLESRKGLIEQSYYDELKNQRAKAMLSLQVQAETGAADAASQIGELEKKDPVAAQLLNETNPWKLIGRRRAVAQLAGPEIGRALEDDLSANAGELSRLRPDSPEIEKRRVQLTAQVLDRFGLTGDEPEVQFYVTPRLNKSWDDYRDKQRKFYDAAVEESTRNTTVSGTTATVEQMLTKGVEVQGVTFKPGSPEWKQYGPAMITYGLDQQLRLLSPEARKRTIQFLREQVTSFFVQDPFAAELLSNVRGGDPSMPYEKRPTWGAMAPFETLELQVRGQEAAQKQFDLGQQTVERKLDEAWNKGPGSMDPNDPAFIQAVGQVRGLGAAMQFADIDSYLVRKARERSEFTQVVRPPDPFAVEDFIVAIGQVGPGAWTDDPNSHQNALRNAREIANLNPTPEGRKDDYQRMVSAINKAREGATEFDREVKERVNSAVLQDLDSKDVREIRNQQKAGKKSGDALAQALAQQMAGGASATQAISATYQDAKLTAFTNTVSRLHERAALTAINQWKADHPGQVLSPTAKSVVISQAEIAVRKSPEWARALKELTGRNPGEAGPRTVGTDPKNARGVPRAGAKSLPDSTVRNYENRPVMDGKWVRDELVRLQTNKPVSGELYNMANRAGTSTFRYLLDQLKFYPKLDPSGDAKRWLEQKQKQQSANRKVSSSQLPNIQGATVGSAPAGYNPFANGGWLMRMFTPPAVAGTLPPSYLQRSRPMTSTTGGGNGMNGLLALIRSGEGGWDSVNFGTVNNTGRGIGTITNRSIGSLEAMQAKDQVFAVGAYQFTPGVLARARRESGLSPNAPFTPENQNRLAMALITGSKRPDLADYITGRSNNLNAAHQDIASEWAALQAPNGRGVYDGDKAGNRASIPASRVRAMLEQARREYLSQQRRS